MSLKKWIMLYLIIPMVTLLTLFTFNFIIDPYSITSYNLFNIPNKFARDDRKEKVAKLSTERTYDNILFGSSHVYSMNPLVMSRYLGGRSYNSGVGTARIEDHLGFLLFLERIGKLPKNVLLGLDFYSFNQNVETNNYFLGNDELNFLHKQQQSDLYFSKFLSIDATRASFKTLSNFLKHKKEKPRFDAYGTAGGASAIFEYYPKTITDESFMAEDVAKGIKDITTLSYTVISETRLEYIQRIVALCQRNNINCTFFITPLNGQLMDEIEKDTVLSDTLLRFKTRLAELTDYYDFISHNAINDNRFYFGGDTMHTTTFTGNLVMARIFHDTNISLPQDFGIPVHH